MLRLDNLFYYHHHQSMQFSLTMQTGERVAILGPSGAGKSTLLSLIAGFLPASSGTITLNGQNHTYSSPAQRPVSMLFQENNLFPHLSIARNIGLGIHPGLKLSTAQQRKVTTIARRVGLDDALPRLPAELSGGQRQRAALARCLLRQQPVLLLDEPFSALDPALRSEMLKLVDEICLERQLTLLMVSHSLQDAQLIAAHSLIVTNGRICWQGDTDKLHRGEIPEAQFLGIPSTDKQDNQRVL